MEICCPHLQWMMMIIMRDQTKHQPLYIAPIVLFMRNNIYSYVMDGIVNVVGLGWLYYALAFDCLQPPFPINTITSGEIYFYSPVFQVISFPLIGIINFMIRNMLCEVGPVGLVHTHLPYFTYLPQSIAQL